MKNLLVGLSPCPLWVQIDHEQIPYSKQKLRTSGVLVKEGAEILKEYRPGGRNKKQSGFIRDYTTLAIAVKNSFCDFFYPNFNLNSKLMYCYDKSNSK
jgi:hypothetical protein